MSLDFTIDDARNGDLDAAKYLFGFIQQPRQRWFLSDICRSAAVKGHVEIVKEYLKRGVEVTWNDNNLAPIIANGHIRVLECIENVRDKITAECLLRTGKSEDIAPSANALVYVTLNKAPLWGFVYRECFPGKGIWNRLWLVCNLMRGTVRVDPEKPDEEWGADPTYDSNLGMLICSYVD